MTVTLLAFLFFQSSACFFKNPEMVSHLLWCQLQRRYLSSYRFMLPFRDIYITLSSLGVPAVVWGAQFCRKPSFHHQHHRHRVKLQWLLLLERAHVVRTKTKWDHLGCNNFHPSGPSVIYLWCVFFVFVFISFKFKTIHYIYHICFTCTSFN